MKKYIRKVGAICLALAMMCGLFACADTPKTTKDNNCLTIICTSFAAKEIALALTQNWLTLPTGHGYDSLQIQILGRSGRDFHSYEPTAHDLVSLYNADVFVYLGETAEPWVASALSAVDSQSLVFDMMASCEAFLLPTGHDSGTCDPEHDHEHTEGVVYDEHIWMSLSIMMQLTSAMSQALQTMLPHAAQLIAENENVYLAELEDLDQQYKEMMTEAKREEVLIADRHPFAYLLHDYGITAHAAFPGCSSETEASFATQATLLETIKSQSLPYIIQTEGGESSIAKTLAEATGAEILTLHACQIMTEEERLHTTYLDIMEENLETLRLALCSDPLPAM